MQMSLGLIARHLPLMAAPWFMRSGAPYLVHPIVEAHAAEFQQAAPTGSFENAAAMRVPRAAHTATALSNARVLIAGGFTTKANSAQGGELYDARTVRFQPLPPMMVLRHSHSATLLPNGKVLIAGGYGAGNATLAAAELFDPTTGRFTSTGSLLASRAGHMAVLLDNGKVLIAGGVGPEWSFLSSAELYDPATGTFTQTGAMTELRESHTATRLLDGRVLVTGGHRGRRADIMLYTSAETYDVRTGQFSRTGDMRVRRHKHDAVLLRDGRVLVTGGSDERDSDGAYTSTELFDSRTGTFTPGPAMRLARYKHNGTSVLLPDGSVLVAGGASQAERYDPAAGTFTLVGGAVRLNGQFSAAAPLDAGGVLLTGGYGAGRGPTVETWLYRP
ncbi:MAG TPA: kelch repeat-containing protein [Gemmatimonas sp.]|nr:kelch repeat-containing protein [Gemmatimonas sp.]